MIRFILRCEKQLGCGLVTEDHYTIDAAVPRLEAELTSGGYGDEIYERNSLVGCEILKQESTSELHNEKTIEKNVKNIFKD